MLFISCKYDVTENKKNQMKLKQEKIEH